MNILKMLFFRHVAQKWAFKNGILVDISRIYEFVSQKKEKMIKVKILYSKMFEHLEKSEQTRKARIKDRCRVFVKVILQNRQKKTDKVET